MILPKLATSCLAHERPGVKPPTQRGRDFRQGTNQPLHSTLSQVLLTLFPECLARFPHGTLCAISMTGRYLALGESYPLSSDCTSKQSYSLAGPQREHGTGPYGPETLYGIPEYDRSSSPAHTPTACSYPTFRKRANRPDSGLGFSPFIRHYLGNHCCFLFLRRLICLNSAGPITPVR